MGSGESFADRLVSDEGVTAPLAVAAGNVVSGRDGGVLSDFRTVSKKPRLLMRVFLEKIIGGIETRLAFGGFADFFHFGGRHH